jgi:hypothetical protein
LFCSIHHNERKQMSTTINASERLAVNMDWAVRKHGYRWALLREYEGEEWRNWEKDNTVAHGSDNILWMMWIGFSNGIRDFAARLEDSTIEELIREEQIIHKRTGNDRLAEFNYERSFSDIVEGDQ